MRVRLLAISAALVAAVSPCLAHSAEELNHHWDMPAYRIEMLTQIAMMTGLAAVIAAALWLKKTIKSRRSDG